jgi:hypothetical protein
VIIYMVVMLSIHISYVNKKFPGSMSSMISSSRNIIEHRSKEKRIELSIYIAQLIIKCHNSLLNLDRVDIEKCCV